MILKILIVLLWTGSAYLFFAVFLYGIVQSTQGEYLYVLICGLDRDVCPNKRMSGSSVAAKMVQPNPNNRIPDSRLIGLP